MYSMRAFVIRFFRYGEYVLRLLIEPIIAYSKQKHRKHCSQNSSLNIITLKL